MNKSFITKEKLFELLSEMNLYDVIEKFEFYKAKLIWPLSKLFFKNGNFFLLFKVFFYLNDVIRNNVQVSFNDLIYMKGNLYEITCT